MGTMVGLTILALQKKALFQIGIAHPSCFSHAGDLHHKIHPASAAE